MLTPCIVPLIFKLCHWNVVYEIYILSNVFTYFASVWGGALDAYRLYGFDKALHFSSGWLITTAAVILYFTIKGDRKFQSKREFAIFLIFINAVNMAVAQLWEFYEYVMLIFFKNDCINHYTKGFMTALPICCVPRWQVSVLRSFLFYIIKMEEEVFLSIFMRNFMTEMWGNKYVLFQSFIT